MTLDQDHTMILSITTSHALDSQEQHSFYDQQHDSHTSTLSPQIHDQNPTSPELESKTVPSKENMEPEPETVQPNTISKPEPSIRNSNRPRKQPKCLENFHCFSITTKGDSKTPAGLMP